MDLTQPDFPPPSVIDPETPKNAWAGSREGFTRVSARASGRPLATHQYSSVQYLARSNTIIWTAGPAHVGGPKPGCTYAYRLDGDGWTGQDDDIAFPARFEDYFSTVGVDQYDAMPRGIFSVQVVDNVADEVWCGLPNGSAGGAAIIRINSTAQGSKYKYVELLNNGNNMIESTAAIGWAIEGEPWLVYVSEFRPSAFHIVHRTYDAGPTGASLAQWEPRRRKSWNVNVMPLNGLAINRLPTPRPGYGPGAQAGNSMDALRSSICYDRAQRCFYAVIYQLDATPLMDVYRIVPPASDAMVLNIGGVESVADWTSEKLAKHPDSIVELPQAMRTDSPNTADGKEFYPQHGNLCVLQTPVHGLFFMHSTMTQPIFWRLS
jgi:hypothetical protein